MNILIDIGHPAHVHYFRNVFKIMTTKGHRFLFTARNRDVIFELLQQYGIPFHNRGRGSEDRVGKLLYMLYADYYLLKKSRLFRPDLFLSFSSPYAAQVSRILNLPHIALNDTEHTDKMHKRFTYPFSEFIITPDSYQNELGYKHIRMNCFMEWFYLHKKYYTPNPSIFNLLRTQPSEKYVILRFVSWGAFHDVNQSGISLETARQIVELLKTKYQIFISSEKDVPDEFKQYKIQIPPERMHDALAYAMLYVGESGTMASESALLGTPAVYINSLPLMCYLKKEQEFGILKHFSSSSGILEYLKAIIQNPSLKEETMKKKNSMVKGFIDPTAFLAWFLENYPQSAALMKENPQVQYSLPTLE